MQFTYIQVLLILIQTIKTKKKMLVMAIHPQKKVCLVSQKEKNTPIPYELFF